MKLTLFLMVWNTSHLLARTLETLKKQCIDDWELLIIDDMSEDDVSLVIENHGQGLPIKYHRLEHDFGMRGNTFALNYGLDRAEGEVVMWSTPEVMLSPGTLTAVYDILHLSDKLWVTVPSHGLKEKIQLHIDDVDWKSSVHEIKNLVKDLDPNDRASIWFYTNFYEGGRRNSLSRVSYGNNQTVGVLREQWLDNIGHFPLFLDYGTDDPWVSGTRKGAGYTDVTLWGYEAYHQWHAKITYWMALGKAPNWNKWGHTTNNLMNDPTISVGGTCEIWDGGNKEQMSQEEIQAGLSVQKFVHDTGFRSKHDQTHDS